MAAKNRLGMFICVGMMSLIGFQSVINIGMTVRLLPVLGITLPFFSSGGSSVLTLFLGIGLGPERPSFQPRRKKGNHFHQTFLKARRPRPLWKGASPFGESKRGLIA